MLKSGAIDVVDTDHLQLKHKLMTDPAFLLNFSLPEELANGTPVPAFHIDTFNDMIGPWPYICEVLPRDHAKTTLAKLAVVYLIMFTEWRFVLYIGNTHTLATACILDIINIIRSDNWTNYIYNEYGSDIIWETEQEGQGFFKFILGKDTKYEKRVIIKSGGIGQSMRGINVDNQRPQVAVMDDIESTEDLKTNKNYFDNNMKWFYGTFLKAMSKFGHKVIQLGNMIDIKCMVKVHSESPDWHSRRYGCIKEDGTPLWPDAWSLEALGLDFAKYKRVGQASTWYAEMMNMPLAAGLGLIKSEEIGYRPQPLPQEVEHAFITLDPAISGNTWGHKSSITVHGYTNNAWQVVEQHNEVGIGALQTFNIIIGFCFKWRAFTVGIEAVAYQAVLKDLFTHFALERHIIGIQFVDLYASAQKTERLAGWAEMLKAKSYYLNDDDVECTTQLLLYDPKKKENDCDAIDSAAYGPQMLANYMDLILNTFDGGIPPPDTNAGILEIASI